MTRLALIDGTNVVMRCAAVMAAKAPADEVCSVAYRQIAAFVDHVDATHLIVAFDGAGESFRKLLCPQYKANRTTDTRPWIVDATADLLSRGIVTAASDHAEADDVIATLVQRTAPRTVHILSSDSDLLVLSSSRVHTWQFGRKGEPKFVERSEASIIAQYGVLPTQLPMYKALVGEPGDNVKGVAKIGPVSARRLLADIDKPDELREKLTGAQWSDFERAYRVVLLYTAVELPAFPARGCEVQRRAAA